MKKLKQFQQMQKALREIIALLKDKRKATPLSVSDIAILECAKKVFPENENVVESKALELFSRNKSRQYVAEFLFREFNDSITWEQAKEITDEQYHVHLEKSIPTEN